MEIFSCPEELLHNLYTLDPGESRRLWKKQIFERWEHKCAYCGSEENLTLDHIIPQSKGGNNHTPNVLCACERCNRSKAHFNWEDWYFRQEFFDKKRYDDINDWITQMPKRDLKVYRPRKNINY